MRSHNDKRKIYGQVSFRCRQSTVVAATPPVRCQQKSSWEASSAKGVSRGGGQMYVAIFGDGVLKIVNKREVYHAACKYVKTHPHPVYYKWYQQRSLQRWVIFVVLIIIKSVVTGQALVTLELRNTPGNKHKTNQRWYTHISQLTRFMPPPETYKSEIGSQPTMCQVHTA